MAEKKTDSRRDVLLLYHGTEGKDKVERIKRAWRTMDTQIETVDTVDVDELECPSDYQCLFQIMQNEDIITNTVKSIKNFNLNNLIQEMNPSFKGPVAPYFERQFHSLLLQGYQKLSCLGHFNIDSDDIFDELRPSLCHFYHSIDPDIELPSHLIPKSKLQKQQVSPYSEQNETIIYERDSERDGIQITKREQKVSRDLFSELDQLDDYKIVFLINADDENDADDILTISRKLDRHLYVYCSTIRTEDWEDENFEVIRHSWVYLLMN